MQAFELSRMPSTAGRRLGGVLFLLVTTLCVLANPTAAQEHNQPPEGYQALFNGKDLVGWHAMGHFDPRELAAMSEEARQAKHAEDWKVATKHWTVQDGELVNDGDGPYLTTDADYENIDFWIDYKTVAKADSGIYLRATPQVQIWDYTQEGGKWDIGADKGSGGLWNNAPGSGGKDPLVLADKPFGEWNRFRIRQIGAMTWIWLNDQLVVDGAPLHNFWDRSQPLLRSGPIQLQTHGGEIRWRNIFLREIPWDEALAELRKQNTQGFEPLLKDDMSGWKGPVENYVLNDGVLMCKPGAGGTIYTAEEYDDFVVCVEFKLPPGGNNGLAIRYPGDGDTAYVGMCELQVLDSEHPKYAGLDDRQYHGSAYGMAAAARGYLRPTGEWNFQKVTVQGSTIRVELNGYVILDTDLSKISDYMANSPHPGKDRKTGHFGFAGHGDAVEFRQVMIKSL
jgi:hypothetical protein